MSIKFVLKIINTWYYDKGTSAKDSQSVKTQHLSEYVYDQFFVIIST